MDNCKILFIGDPHFKVNNIEIIDEFIHQCLERLTPTCAHMCNVGDILQQRKEASYKLLIKPLIL